MNWRLHSKWKWNTHCAFNQVIPVLSLPVSTVYLHFLLGFSCSLLWCQSILAPRCKHLDFIFDPVFTCSCNMSESTEIDEGFYSRQLWVYTVFWCQVQLHIPQNYRFTACPTCAQVRSGSRGHAADGHSQRPHCRHARCWSGNSKKCYSVRSQACHCSGRGSGWVDRPVLTGTDSKVSPCCFSVI